jgi:hypothetical protein
MSPIASVHVPQTIVCNTIGMSLIVGEALNRRADLQKRVAQLQDRLSNCVLAQEDEEPPESVARRDQSGHGWLGLRADSL